MPKMSFNPETAKQGLGAPEKGKFKVVSACIRNIKTDFRPNQIYLVLTQQALDDNWGTLREAENVELKLSFGEKSLEHYRPGVAKDMNDQDPIAQSDVPDAEGNTLVPSDPNTIEPLNRSCGAIVFMESLKKQGFPTAILDRAYTPDFAGLEYELASYTPIECNDKFATRLNKKPMKDRTDPTKEVTITYKVCVAWHNPNYLGTTSSAENSAAPTSPQAPVSTNIETIAQDVLKQVVESKRGTEIKSHSNLVGFCSQIYTKKMVQGVKLADVQKFVRDESWVADKMIELGAVPAYDDAGKVTSYNVPKE